MVAELIRCFTRAKSIQQALELLESEHAHVLIVAPSTCSAFALARAVCRRRPCFVTSGPVSAHPGLRLTPHVRPPSDITQALAGQSHLSRSVISFPDQHVGSYAGQVMIPFLNTRYSFSAFDAVLVTRHRPPVYAFATRSGSCDFALHQIRYTELFSVDGRLLSLPGLVRRLLVYLEQELTMPPEDWLAHDCFKVRSEAVRWLRVREELKDIECLLRMHLSSRYCDRPRTEMALAAIVARQKLFGRSAST
jgi:hypothetical protein